MTCSRNLLKTFKILLTKPKPIRKCHNMIFNFLQKSNDFFSPKIKVTKYSLLIFIFHICAKFQTKKKKKDSSWHVYLNIFYHIVTFWKNYIIFRIWWVPQPFLEKVFMINMEVLSNRKKKPSSASRVVNLFYIFVLYCSESHKVTLLFRVSTFRVEMNTIENMCPIWKAHLWCIHTWC